MVDFSRWKTPIESSNHYIGRSSFGRVFRLENCGHEKAIANSRFWTEIRAGITTFFTMAYIISVNAAILSDTGGTCVCHDPKDSSCTSSNQFATDYALCVQDISRDIVTATSVISALSSIMFGFLTNLPVALAPGMGVNAYFAYQVVGFHGSGHITYGQALAAVFIEGFVFLFLSLIGMRQWLVRILPTCIKVASGCGIGLFLAIIGLSGSAGIGVISGGGSAAPTALAGCPAEYVDAISGACIGHLMQSPTMWLGLCVGGFVTIYLMAYKVKSAMIVGIVLVSIFSWPRNTSFTFFPNTPEGDSAFSFFKQVAGFHPLKYTGNAIDWNIIHADPGLFALALFTFLYVDIIDCTGTLYAMARFSGVVDPETGSFPRSTLAYCTDAVSISIGALLGVSPVTAFIESGAGIAEGGRTGLTAITTGICFLISVFFSPIFASIPPWATGCVLVLVGCMMMKQVIFINWRYIGDAVPAFVTLIMMPFSYSIAYGLIAGILSYVVINGLIWITAKGTFGSIVPEDLDQKEYWTYKPSGHLPWFIRLAQDPKKLFRHQDRQFEMQHRSYESTGSTTSVIEHPIEPKIRPFDTQK